MARSRDRRPPDRERPVGRQAKRPDRERPVGRASGGDRPTTDAAFPPGLEHAGRGLVLASWAGTLVFSVVALATVVWLDTLAPVAIAVSLLQFALGCVWFGWAIVVAADRSRTDAIGIGGLFFLVGAAPRSVQRSLMGSVAVQTAVSLVAAGLRPFSSLAFGILAPMWSLGLAGVWGARHGVFARRGGGEAS